VQVAVSTAHNPVESGSWLPVHGIPEACWWHVTGCRVPAAAGRARRNAS
jgi:hypothetical protein